jgi:hypothetical protein
LFRYWLQCECQDIFNDMRIIDGHKWIWVCMLTKSKEMVEGLWGRKRPGDACVGKETHERAHG